MLHVMGKAPILPAIAIGYEVPPFAGAPGLVDKEYDNGVNNQEFPRWLVNIDSQVAGYACSQKAFVGCLMSLDSNRTQALQNPDELIAVLRSERPSNSNESRTQVTFTHGSLFDQAQLEYLHEFIGQYFRIPRFRGGLEAFVEFAKCDLLEYFKGWRVTSLQLREGAMTSSWWPPENDRAELTTYVQDFDDLVIDDSISFDKQVLTQLDALEKYASNFLVGALAEFADRSNGPDCFLLWGNSD